MDNWCILTPCLPNFCSKSSTGIRLKSSKVWMLRRNKAAVVFFPMPHILLTGSGFKKSLTLSDCTTVNPSGLSISEAIFATNLHGATPAETVKPVSFKTTCLIFFAISTGVPKRCAEPVTSKNASSMDKGSTSGVNRRNILKILFETSWYLDNLTGIKIPFGQRSMAFATGRAE